MKLDNIKIRLYMIWLVAVVFLPNVRSQTYEISAFLNYSSHTYSGFINPIYNANNIHTFNSTYVSRDSVPQEKILKRIYEQSSFAQLDTIGRFVYIKDENPTFTHQLEIEYPRMIDSNHVQEMTNPYIYEYSHNPILCLSQFKLETSKSGQLKSSIIWNPNREAKCLKKTYHTFLGDINRRLKPECRSMQWPFFDKPVTYLPANYISRYINQDTSICPEDSNIKIIHVDTCQSVDSAYYIAQYAGSGRIVFHCLIEFFYPYYSITQFRTERTEQKYLTIMDRAFIKFDGRPDEYHLFDYQSEKIILKTIWLYNMAGNVRKIETNRYVPDDCSIDIREFRYTYYE